MQARLTHPFMLSWHITMSAEEIESYGRNNLRCYSCHSFPPSLGFRLSLTRTAPSNTLVHSLQVAQYLIALLFPLNIIFVILFAIRRVKVLLRILQVLCYIESHVLQVLSQGLTARPATD